MALKRLSLIRGNSRTWNLTFKTAAGVPYCLKNWVVFFTLKTNIDLPDASASLQKIVTAFADSTSGTSGVAVVALTPADTESLAIGDYNFDIKITTAANEQFTVMKGKLDLEYNVTKTAGTAGTTP